MLATDTQTGLQQLTTTIVHMTLSMTAQLVLLRYSLYVERASVESQISKAAWYGCDSAEIGALSPRWFSLS